MAGTYHLPKLVGYSNALDMILLGKNIKPDKAKKIGLVDLVVDAAALESVALMQAEGLVNGTVKISKRKRDWMGYFLESNPIGNKVMFDQAKKGVDKATGTRVIYIITSSYVATFWLFLYSFSRYLKVESIQLLIKF